MICRATQLRLLRRLAGVALSALVAGRVMAHTLWIAAHRDDAVFRPVTAQRIAAQVATLRGLTGE